MKTPFLKKRKRTETQLDPRIKENIFAVLQDYHDENELMLVDLEIDLNDAHGPYILAYLDSHPDINEITFESKLSSNTLSLLAQHNHLTKLTSLKPPEGSQEIKINNQVIESLESNQSLTELDLTNFRLEPEQAASLLRKQNLSRLSLEITYLSKDLLAAALKNVTLTTLFLGLEEVASFWEVSRLAQHPTITELSLVGGGINSTKASCFLGNQVLKSLDINNNEAIDNDGAALLLGHKSLTRLDLTECDIDLTPKTIAVALNNLNLTTLVLWANSVKDEGAAILSRHPNLTSLNLCGCDIGSQGAFYLASNSRFLSLDLSCNRKIRFLGAIALAFNQSLSYLDIRRCDIGNLGALFLLGNQTLQYLNFLDDERAYSSEEYYPISIERQNELHNLPKRNTALQSQYHEAVGKNLRNHLPTDLVNMVRDYTKGEYPYRYQLFNNRLNSRDIPQLRRHLPQINQIFSVLR